MGRKAKSELEDYINEEKCPSCGKAFVRMSPDWAYKEPVHNGATMWFCSWSCLCAWQKEHQKKKKRRYARTQPYNKRKEKKNNGA